MIFKRGDTYYYEFDLRGRRYREVHATAKPASGSPDGSSASDSDS